MMPRLNCGIYQLRPSLTAIGRRPSAPQRGVGFLLYVEKGQAHGPVFEFLVPDVQATKRKLLAAGCTVEEEDPSIPRCYIRDPYGIP